MFDAKEDTFFNEKNAEDESAEKLRSMIDAGVKAPLAEVTPGEKVTGTITKIGSEYAFVDIGGKTEAVIALQELAPAEGEKAPAVGDPITAYVIAANGGETVLSFRYAKKGGSAATQELRDAMNNKVPIQGKITGVNKGGFNVKVLGVRAFCPVSQIDLKFTEDSNAYIGKTLDFVITRITEGGRNVVVSRIPLLEGGLEKKIDALAKAGEVRLVLKGKISKIADFGLFIDLGDCEGLVHVSEVSWERAEDLAGSFTVGQEVECVVLSVEKKTPLRNSKISLSIKQTIDNPWNTVSKRFSVGQSYAGTVTRLAPFGAFVELNPGIEGLVHISEMSWLKRLHHPSEVVSVGQQVHVTVLAIDEKKKTISLTLKDVANDPWRDINYRFPAGSDVTGNVVRKAKFGYFIDLAEGVTGLLPLANIAPEKKTSISVGSQITVQVQSLDVENRRISLSFGLQESIQESKTVKEYLTQQAVAPAQDRASSTEFGAALLEALKKKN
jgi:small subunit ribosomal protein S1